MTPLVELVDVSAGYGRIPVLHNVSMHVSQGEAVAVLGANGAGKSTLLRTIMRQVAMASGELWVGGREVSNTHTHVLAREGFLLVPEGRGILPFMSVRDNLQLGTDIVREAGVSGDDRWAEVLELFPIIGERLSQMAGELSGGQQQMLAIARALLARPRCLMLDEPSLGLAPRLIEDTFGALRVVIEKLGTTVLLAEQNIGEALRLVDRVYVLERGRVVIDRPARELSGDPALTEAYLGGSWSGVSTDEVES